MKTINQTEAKTEIANRRPFQGSNFSGVLCALPNAGRLPSEWALRLRTTPIWYVVFSYGTPIAWVEIGGNVVIPDVKHSQTTTRHQDVAAEALTGNRRMRTSL